MFRDGTQLTHPVRIERLLVQLDVAKMIKNQLQVGHAPSNLGDVWQRVFANQKVDRFPRISGQLQVSKEFIGQLVLISARQSIANVTLVSAQLIEQRLELICPDDFRQVANDTTVEFLVVRRDLQIPLVVRQTLSSLNDNDSANIVGLGNGLVPRRQHRLIENLVVL